MQALIFDRAGLRVGERSEPEPGPADALVRVRLAGVCNTDLEIVRGYMGFEGVLGHELVGEVLAAPDPSWIGRRVCADINAACGTCATCRAGDPHHCPTRTVIGIVARDGAFAERMAIPMRNLFMVPEHVTDEQAVFVEPLAAAFEILEQVPLTSTDRVVVLGDGKLGLLCAMALATSPADVSIVGRHESKLAIAAAAGVRIESSPSARSFDVVVEATGSSEGLQTAMDLVRPRGTIVLKSTFAGRASVDTNRLVIDEVKLVGSRCGPFDRALEALATGAVDPRAMIVARYPLQRADEAVRHASTRGTLKVLVEPG